MSMSTMALFSCNGAITHLVFAFCLASSLSSACGGTSSNWKRDRTRPTVTIPQGKLRGINMLTYENRTIYGFTGVPYAQPPIGSLRFKAPVAPNPWHGTYDASSDTKLCLQITLQRVITGYEDCLYLNLYTPKLPSKKSSTSLPVMLFIVGGAFQTANNSRFRYSPDFLLEQDVILIVPSYRLGPLGFLSTGDEVAPGNFGLKDIVQALRWVRDNVRYFGGDPDNVTLFGGSSGAMSVSFLSLSNATKGLVHKYITQSGAALMPDLQEPNETYITRAKKLGEHFDCPTQSSKLLVECLRGVNASQLIDTLQVFLEWRQYPLYAWFPTIEPDVEGALITQSPARLMDAQKMHDLPWLNSDVRDEGLFYVSTFSQAPSQFDVILANLSVALPLIVGYSRGSSNPAALTEGLISYYLNDLTADRSSLITNISELITDVQILYPTYRMLQQRLTYAREPSYTMSMEHRGVFSYSYYSSGGLTNYTGIAHGDEIIYLFKDHGNLFGPPSYQYSKTDLKLVKKMVAMWTSFAKCGEPTPADANGKILWKPYTAKKNYLQVGNGASIEMRVKYDLQKKRMEFLHELMTAVPFK